MNMNMNPNWKEMDLSILDQEIFWSWSVSKNERLELGT